MAPTAPVAQTFACVNCGAAIAVTGAPSVECPFCRKQQRVPKELLQQVRRYQSDAERLESRMHTVRAEKATWEVWYDNDGKAKIGGWKAAALFAGPMLLVMGIGYTLLLTHRVDERTMGSLMTAGVIGSYLLGFVIYFARSGKGALKKPKRAASVGARCPQCGGALSFELGAAARICPNCGHAALAATQVMNRAIGEAQFQLQEERMLRYRLERNAISRVYGYSVGNKVVYIVVGSFLVPLGGGTIAFTVQAIAGADDVPAGALTLMWGLTACLVGVLLGIRNFRDARRRRFRGMAEEVASALSGVVHTDLGAWVSWLNAYWNGPYPVQQLYVGAAFHIVLASVDEYPVAIDMDPVPADSEHGKPRTDVLLAANMPVDREAMPIPQDLRTQAHSLGFTVASSTAGFLASGTELRALHLGTSENVASILVAIGQVLVECARRSAVGPASPIP